MTKQPHLQVSPSVLFFLSLKDHLSLLPNVLYKCPILQTKPDKTGNKEKNADGGESAKRVKPAFSKAIADIKVNLEK